MSDEREDEEHLEQHQRLRCVATAIGYNELAKQATTLGEKVYYRLCRDVADEEFVALGGKSPFVNEDPVLVIEVPGTMPHIRFIAKDIEMMRAAVKSHDDSAAPTEQPAFTESGDRIGIPFATPQPSKPTP